MLRLALVALGVLMGWVVWRSTKWEQPSRIYTWLLHPKDDNRP